MSMNDFTHIWQPPAAGSRRVLLLLHGTGGDERSLLPLAPMIDASAGVLSPRGKVLEHGMPRFFRRFAEGVLDEDDVRFRAGELADWLRDAQRTHAVSPSDVVAVGYSNGANIAAAMLLLHGGVVGGAALLRPMVPLRTLPPAPDALAGVRVFISAGTRDPITPAPGAQALATLLQQHGAAITLEMDQGDHALPRSAIDAAKDWASGGKGSPAIR